MPNNKEILFFLSGGQSNQETIQSLGGPPSITIIRDGINNLFNDLTQSESLAGHTDYRCFYVKNVSQQDWEDVSVYMKDQKEGGAFGTLGIESGNDTQQFSIISKYGANGGYFTVSFGENVNIQVVYNSDIDIWANEFREALVDTGDCSDVQVTGKIYSAISSPYTMFQTFLIKFIGTDGNRKQPLIQPEENHLTCNPGDSVELTCSKSVSGAPANTIAVQIPNSTTPPFNAVFQITTINSALDLGTIKVGESLPIWIKRDISPGTTQLLNDNFIIGLRGTSSIF